MKKLIGGVLLLCSTALFAFAYPDTNDGAEMGPVPNKEFDVRFGALLVWATTLNESALKWNTVCVPDQTTGCAEWRAVLVEQFVMFVEAAKSYKTEGKDCEADLRRRVVKHEVRVAAWNVNCVSTPATEGCKTETAALLVELETLRKDIDKCGTEKL